MVDREAELGIVVGAPLRMVDESATLDGIAGYTIVNDISMRDWQLRTSEFLQGKTFEASTPLGPPKTLGSTAYPVLESAPGSYVLEHIPAVV
jgi:2-keto-4-pentenoate hydratase/2-oxohepta-3-ene-1,7-dioic acid hydratase in catechol pathway